jgi:hypothetical protein
VPSEAAAEPPERLRREEVERRQQAMRTKRRRPGPELGYDPQAASEALPGVPDVPPTDVEEEER